MRSEVDSESKLRELNSTKNNKTINRDRPKERIWLRKFKQRTDRKNNYLGTKMHKTKEKD